MKNNSQLIYDHAFKDNGLSETAGPKSTPRIRLAIKMAADWLDPDDSVTAWCGCIRGLWGLETATGVPPEHFRAREWLKWGEPVKLAEIIQGDTVVIKRQGGHHVALFHSFVGGTGDLYLFGGNQSNATNIKKFDRALVVGVRRGRGA